MSLDIVFLIVLIWYGLKGYRKGLVHVIFSAVAIIIATLGALKLSGKISKYFFNDGNTISSWTPMLSFLVTFLAILFTIFLISKTIDSTLKKVKLGGLNRIAGMALYGIMVAFFFSTILWLGDKVNLIKPETKASSVTYPFIAPIAAKGFVWIGNIIPIVKSSYSELDQIFDKVNNDL
ncbi:MAG TPA: CvpA family protein [Edaphocola sp.]|nr:CvpA family protein [Edaphocola sp.]